MNINPIIKLDYPDPDVIRVADTYYMVSTTMYFMPGCEILQSYDLIHWEHAAYVYETLDGTLAQRLEEGQNIYGQGMWAATMRYYKGGFYICFAANDTQKTYLYTSDNIQGPWQKRNVEGFYHDGSLLFDDDGKVYIVYGNKNIWLTELREDLSGPLEGGLHRRVVSDEGNTRLGYEGAHFYKINGRYYLFLIHSRRDRWMRTEACFVSDSLEGEFTGGDVLEDDRGYCGQGVAQGGIVDTPDGEWYAVLFQDLGAVGRIPVLIPVTWENNYPVFGKAGKIPDEIITKSTRPKYEYTPLIGSDDFRCQPDESGKVRLDKKWQFNHEPDKTAFAIDGKEGYYEITAKKPCRNLTQAVNTITQRMLFPSCSAEVTVDAGKLREGDYAGICVLQSCCGMVAVTRRDGQLYLVMRSREAKELSFMPVDMETSKEAEWTAELSSSEVVRLKIAVNFNHMKDESTFYYKDGGEYQQIGINHKLYFKLDHFTGCRFGLFLYATKETGGKVRFKDFVYHTTANSHNETKN